MEQKSDSEAFVELRNTIDDVFLKPVREEMGSLSDETRSVSEELQELTEKYANLKSEVEGLEELTKTGSQEIYALIEDALYDEDYTPDKKSLVEANAEHIQDLSSNLEALHQDHNSQTSDLVDQVAENRSAIDDWSDESRELQQKQLEEVEIQTNHLTEKLEEKTSALIEEAEELSQQLQAIKEQTASDSDEITSTINELQSQQKHQRKLVLGLYALFVAFGIASAVGFFFY